MNLLRDDHVRDRRLRGRAGGRHDRGAALRSHGGGRGAGGRDRRGGAPPHGGGGPGRPPGAPRPCPRGLSAWRACRPIRPPSPPIMTRATPEKNVPAQTKYAQSCGGLSRDLRKKYQTAAQIADSVPTVIRKMASPAL